MKENGTFKSVGQKAVFSVGTLFDAIGLFMFVITGMGVLICIIDGFSREIILGTMASGILGLVLRMIAKKMMGGTVRTQQYLSLIVDGNVRQIASIAATRRSPETVKRDIEKLIEDGYLEDAYINEVSHQVVIGYKNAAANDNLHSSSSTNSSKSMAGEQKSAARLVTCPCCGANNSLVGRTGECEYCGSPIK